MTSHDKPDSLERFISDVLRDQPLRRAPASLEARVLARIEERELMGATQAGFLRWSLTARVLLIVALLAVAKLTLDLVMWLFTSGTPVTQTVESSIGWAKSAANLFVTFASIGHTLFDVVPSSLLALVLAVSAGLYILLFALGATAYRTLYLTK